MGGAFAVELSWILNTVFFDFTGIALSKINYKRPVSAMVLSFFIGFNEEAWKLIATLLILDWHWKQSKNKVNLFVFGIVISLGFDFWENFQYGSMFGWPIVFWRSVIPGHQVYGAIWSYGLSEGHYGTKDTDVLLIILCYILAAIYHSMYDFFLFLDISWGFLVAVVLSWIPVIFLYAHLKRLLFFDMKTRQKVTDYSTTKAGSFVRNRKKVQK